MCAAMRRTKVDLSTFRGKRVLVSGHTGFVGSWLSLWLEDLGAMVFGYSLPPIGSPNNYQLTNLTSRLSGEHLGDICSFESLRTLYQEAKPDVVFHLAAQPIVQEAYRAPRETIQTNVVGTAAILDCLVQSAKPCAMIVMTSDKCYENPENGIGLREDDRMGGKDPYSASKGASEIILSSYRDSYFSADEVGTHGVHIASIRAGNIIGGGDWAAHRIIPDIVRAAQQDTSVFLRRPHSTRPWQHVCDPLYGMLQLAANMMKNPSPHWSSAWNFGPSHTEKTTVAELCELFFESWGSGRWEMNTDSTNPCTGMKEANYLQLNTEKAEQELGWTCAWNTQQAVKQTALWYRLHAEGKDARTLCLNDIREHQALLEI